MIVGVLLRNYKCYEGMHFVPICQTVDNAFSAYIGVNGVGKSAILESLDAFFDQREWNINKKGKKGEAFVAPVVLIPKTDISRTSQFSSILRRITDYFLNVDDSANPQLKHPAIQRFLDFRAQLKQQIDLSQYYFFIVGRRNFDRQHAYFSTFHQDLEDTLTREKFDISLLDSILRIVAQRYAYIYVPVEGYAEDVLSLEAEEMKDLMSKDLLGEIDAILNKKALSDKSKRRNTKVSAVRWINDSLDQFMDHVNSTVAEVDSAYSYKIEGRFKKNLTAQDIRDRIIEAYFSIRTLKKHNKELSELSSGEQRKAIIDIAFAFLTQSVESSKIAILAIDEPEGSMHMAACFDQFERLLTLATQTRHQVVVTTHWYGFIPTLQEGSVHYLENSDGPLCQDSCRLS